MFIDTHCHLDHSQFDPDLTSVIEKARQEGISRIILIATGIDSIEKCLKIKRSFPNFVYLCAGFDPFSVSHFQPSHLLVLEKLIQEIQIQAIGEIGLDYHYEKHTKDLQRGIFRQQLLLAKQYNLPVVIHNRDAHQDIIQILNEIKVSHVILHCFSGNLAFAQEMMGLGYYLSFAGNVTFKNSPLSALLPQISLDRLLIETDSPFLAPVPERGKRNEPAFLKFTAEFIAQRLNLSIPEFSKILWGNTKQAFQLKDL